MHLSDYLPLADRRAVRNAWLGWALVLAVSAALAASGSRRSVVPVYRTAAQHWHAGQNIYSGDGCGFVYLPQAAVLFGPLALLPTVPGEILWRSLAVGLFALGVYRWSEAAQRDPQISLFPLTTCLAIPLAWDCARNGQATLPMAGLLMLAIADAGRRNWTRATVWLAIGLAIKPLAVVAILLMGALQRELRGRLLVGIAVVAALPFLTQSPAYVAQQYVACLESLQSTAHLGVVESWAQPFSVLGMAGFTWDERSQSLVRALAAAGTLALCWQVYRRRSAAQDALYLYTLAACYLVLFNPRTENNTYAILGPAIGLFFADACLVQRHYGRAVLLLVMAAGTAGSYQLGKWLLPQCKPVWLAPLAAAGFTTYVLVQLVVEEFRGGIRNTAPPPRRGQWLAWRHSRGLDETEPVATEMRCPRLGPVRGVPAPSSARRRSRAAVPWKCRFRTP